jgi:Cys-tRNA(Pro)/Cys-tRNA(Cys) deacylase
METVVTRCLDQNGLPYRRIFHTKPLFTVDDVARETGASLDQIIKVVVLESREGVMILALLPGNKRLDVKAVSIATGLKLKIMRRERIQEATGLPVGAVSPFGIRGKAYRIIADKGIFNYKRVNISSGHPGMSIHLRSENLKSLVVKDCFKIAKD